MNLNVNDMRTAFEKLREATSLVEPSIVEIALKHVREEHLASDEFIEATRHLPDGIVVRFADGIYSLVTDGNGNLLSFR